jgi:hypothetical protein
VGSLRRAGLMQWWEMSHEVTRSRIQNNLSLFARKACLNLSLPRLYSCWSLPYWVDPFLEGHVWYSVATCLTKSPNHGFKVASPYLRKEGLPRFILSLTSFMWEPPVLYLLFFFTSRSLLYHFWWFLNHHSVFSEENDTLFTPTS